MKPQLFAGILLILFTVTSCNDTAKNNSGKYTSLDYFRQYYGVKQPSKTEIGEWKDVAGGNSGIGYYLKDVRCGLQVGQNNDHKIVEIKDYKNSASLTGVVLNSWIAFKENEKIDFDKSAFVYCSYENKKLNLFYSAFFMDTAMVKLRLDNDSMLSIPLDPKLHSLQMQLDHQPLCNMGDTLNRSSVLKSLEAQEDGSSQVFDTWFECHCK